MCLIVAVHEMGASFGMVAVERQVEVAHKFAAKEVGRKVVIVVVDYIAFAIEYKSDLIRVEKLKLFVIECLFEVDKLVVS